MTWFHSSTGPKKAKKNKTKEKTPRRILLLFKYTRYFQCLLKGNSPPKSSF